MNKLVPNLRFPQFAEESEWEEKKLGEVATFTSSKRVYLEDYVKTGIPFYRGKEITELKQNKKPSDILYITETAYQYFKDNFGVPQINDILITAVGTLGNTMLIKDNTPFYFKDGNLIWLKDINQNSSFIEILLNYNYLEIEKTAIGSSQKALTMVELRKIKITIPSLAEQTQIGNFLTAVDTRISLLKQKLELLKSYKKGIMAQIFSQELRFKDENGQEFPEWEEKTLDKIGEIIGGGTPDTKQTEFWNGNINWFTPTEIKNNFVYQSERKITEKGLKNSSAKLLPIGTVLFTSRATIGDVAITKVECTTNQGFQSFITNKDTNNYFLLNWLKFHKDDFIKLANGSTFLEVSKKAISNVLISLPCLAEQTKIAEFLTAIDKKINLTEQQIVQSEEWKKGLLQAMLV